MAGAASLPWHQRWTMSFAMWVQVMGKAHTVEVGAKRYLDVLLDEQTFTSGIWRGSEKGMTGKLADQVAHWPEIIGNTSAQDDANTVIHEFIE